MILPRHEVIKRLEINCKNNQPVDHQIDQLVDHKIDHLVDQNVDDTSSSLNALKEFSSKRVLLLKSVAKCLHESGRFCYMEVNNNSLVFCAYTVYCKLFMVEKFCNFRGWTGSFKTFPVK